ncbi:MAG: peptidylprolyl isomerase [Clostridia bacterium]|nr:peptidylprolyl isomerase [Clostridia bacterium]
MKRTITVVLALLLTVCSLLLAVSCGKSSTSIDLSKCYTKKLEPVSYETDYVQFEIEGGAYIVVQLYPEIAPITVANFKSLVASHFYDGLTFHRVYPGFMIQGGDPDGNGTGGASTKIKGEFALNGVDNTISHVRGVISMARSKAYDSASSQFFICQADCSASLDGSYAAFGRVIAGMETVDAIVSVPCKVNPVTGETRRDSKGNTYGTFPIDPVTITAVTFVSPAGN